MEKKLNGIVRKLDEDGKLLCELPFKDGELDGYFRLYDEDGKLLCDLPYKAGKLEGVAHKYDSAGNVLFTAEYHNGRLDGHFRGYYPVGKLLFEISCNANEMEMFSEDVRSRLIAEEQRLEALRRQEEIREEIKIKNN